MQEINNNEAKKIRISWIEMLDMSLSLLLDRNFAIAKSKIPIFVLTFCQSANKQA